MRSMANKKKLKSGSASKKFKEYVYDKQLQFIESVSEPNRYLYNIYKYIYTFFWIYSIVFNNILFFLSTYRTESNIDDDASQGQDQCIENEEEIDIESTNYEDTNEPWKRKRGTKQGKKKMDEFEEEFLAALRKTADEDEDKCFLDSLLPTLRLFDNDQKLNFRSRVLATMIEIKTTRTIPTLPSTSTSNNYLNYPHYPPHQGLQGNFPIMPSQPGVDSYKVPDTSDNNWYTRTNE